jgi:hypothetical protein
MLSLLERVHAAATEPGRFAVGLPLSFARPAQQIAEQGCTAVVEDAKARIACRIRQSAQSSAPELSSPGARGSGVQVDECGIDADSAQAERRSKRRDARRRHVINLNVCCPAMDMERVPNGVDALSP